MWVSDTFKVSTHEYLSRLFVFPIWRLVIPPQKSPDRINNRKVRITTCHIVRAHMTNYVHIYYICTQNRFAHIDSLFECNSKTHRAPYSFHSAHIHCLITSYQFLGSFCADSLRGLVFQCQIWHPGIILHHATAGFDISNIIIKLTLYIEDGQCQWETVEQGSHCQTVNGNFWSLHPFDRLGVFAVKENWGPDGLFRYHQMKSKLIILNSLFE